MRKARQRHYAIGIRFHSFDMPVMFAMKSADTQRPIFVFSNARQRYRVVAIRSAKDDGWLHDAYPANLAISASEIS